MLAGTCAVLLLFTLMTTFWDPAKGLGGMSCYVCDDNAQVPCSSPKEYTNCRFCSKVINNGKMSKKCVSIGDVGGGVGFPERMSDAECLVESGISYCACATTRCNSAESLQQSALLLGFGFLFWL